VFPVRYDLDIRFEAFRAVTMKNLVFWVVALSRSCVNRRFGSLQPPSHADSPLADSSTLKMEAICSSEKSVNARSTQRNIPEDDMLRIGCLYNIWGQKNHTLKG
jgi:hypothetical protein